MADYEEPQIIDVENYGSEKDAVFSYEALVMIALKKCIEAGAKEMRNGYWNTKFDRLGNAHRVWIPDTRSEYIEAVQTAEDVLINKIDTDEIVKKNIIKLNEELKKVYNELVNQEKRDWDSISLSIKKERFGKGIVIIPEALGKGLPYYEEHINEKVGIKRRIFRELMRVSTDFEVLDIEEA